MKTYSADLANWRMAKLHDDYVVKAFSHAEMLLRPNAVARHMYETTCPYCGHVDQLLGTIRLGAKELVAKVPMTRQGYEVPDLRDRTSEVLIIHCGACDAPVDPLAYFSPANFYVEKENVQLWEA